MKQTAKKKKENYQIKICLLYKIQSSHSIERHFIVFKLVNKLFRFGFYKNRRKYNNIIYFSLYFRSSSTDMFIIGSFSILNFARVQGGKIQFSSLFSAEWLFTKPLRFFEIFSKFKNFKVISEFLPVSF